MSQFPGLARYDAIQRAPLGTFSALRRPSPVASQYKRQSEMYGQALRTLSRAARRGDAGAAITAIGLRDKANDAGFTPGGIGRSEDTTANITNREQELMGRNQIAEDENSFTRGRLDRRYQSEFSRGPVSMSKWGDPANIEDAGESPVTILPKKLSFAEEDAAKRERLGREKVVTNPNWWTAKR